MTRCDSCARPALIRQNDALSCALCYAGKERERFRLLRRDAKGRHADYLQMRINRLSDLIASLSIMGREREAA